MYRLFVLCLSVVLSVVQCDLKSERMMGNVGFYHLLLLLLSVLFLIERVFKLVLSNFGDFKEANKNVHEPCVPACLQYYQVVRFDLMKVRFPCRFCPFGNSSCTFYRPKTQFVGTRIT